MYKRYQPKNQPQATNTYQKPPQNVQTPLISSKPINNATIQKPQNNNSNRNSQYRTSQNKNNIHRAVLKPPPPPPPQEPEKQKEKKQQKQGKKQKEKNNPLLGLIPTTVYNPETKKVLGFLSTEDLLLIALIFLFMENDENDDPMIIYALIYILISDYIDLGEFLNLLS
ncbi:MAG: hypothetical protein RSB38_07790 [Oscillospiraceae bacterium]